jgi:hypothetical protein
MFFTQHYIKGHEKLFECYKQKFIESLMFEWTIKNFTLVFLKTSNCMIDNSIYP